MYVSRMVTETETKYNISTSDSRPENIFSPPPTRDQYVVVDPSVDDVVSTRGKSIGAAILCGLTGFLLGGPIAGLLTACFGGYTADRGRGKVGDASRAVGEVAVAASDKAKEIGLGRKSEVAVESVVHGVGETIQRPFKRSTSASTDTSKDGSEEK